MPSSSKLKIFLFSIFAYAVIPSPIFAQGNIIYAGAAFIGNSEATNSNFPHLSGVLESKLESGQSRIDSEVIQHLEKLQVPLTFSSESSVGNDQIAVALVFTWENTEFSELQTATRVVLNLQAQALFFDFSSKRVLAAYPIAQQFIDASKGAMEDEEIEKSYEDLIYSSGGIIESFSTLVSENKNKIGRNSLNIKVGVERPSDKANLMMMGMDLEEAYINSLLGFSFERILSNNCNIPIIPYYKDQVIGNKIPARFANGTSYEFILPPEDILLNIKLSDYRVLVLDDSSSEISYGFAAYLSFISIQPLSGTKSFSNEYRLPITATFPKSMEEINKNLWFHEAIFGLMDQLTKSLCENDISWLNEWGMERVNRRDLRTLQDFFDRARI